MSSYSSYLPRGGPRADRSKPGRWLPITRETNPEAFHTPEEQRAANTLVAEITARREAARANRVPSVSSAGSSEHEDSESEDDSGDSGSDFDPAADPKPVKPTTTRKRKATAGLKPQKQPAKRTRKSGPGAKSRAPAKPATQESDHDDVNEDGVAIPNEAETALMGRGDAKKKDKTKITITKNARAIGKPRITAEAGRTGNAGAAHHDGSEGDIADDESEEDNDTSDIPDDALPENSKGWRVGNPVSLPPTYAVPIDLQGSVKYVTLKRAIDFSSADSIRAANKSRRQRIDRARRRIGMPLRRPSVRGREYTDENNFFLDYAQWDYAQANNNAMMPFEELKTLYNDTFPTEHRTAASISSHISKIPGLKNQRSGYIKPAPFQSSLQAVQHANPDPASVEQDDNDQEEVEE